MAGPDRRFLIVRPGLQGVMPLNAQIPHGMAGLSQSTEQLRFGVQKGLSPLGMLSSHGEDSALQRQRSAMGCQPIPCDGWPVIPESCQVAVAIPVLTKVIQAGTER